jgi:3'(2'), 5'-bisphosphate nucleotidase
MMSANQPSPRLTRLMQIAHAAGGRIMTIYNSGFEVAEKSDASPVTDADTAAEAIILDGLRSLDPGANIIAEEAVAGGAVPKVTGEFYLVDPLDGTREFISRNGEFTVNIALIRNGNPVAGVVYAPALSRMYAGEADAGAIMASVDPQAPWNDAVSYEQLSCQDLPDTGRKAVASRSHRDEKTEHWLADNQIADTVAAGSSLKFCLLAEGKAHLYPRFGRTMEWDTAAGHAVLAAAGGSVVEADTGVPLVYGKQARGFDNPAFIASVSKGGI